jgi:hypothetical protein
MTYVAKSGLWANLKEIGSWKPYDFYHYFTSCYRQKYRVEYEDGNSMVRAYQDMETFQKLNNISNAEYKRFIDLAFSRHFNAINIPVAGHMCNKDLYQKLIGQTVRQVRAKDWFSLDARLDRENTQAARDPYAVLDRRLVQEAACK